ncbi:hypothetical protein U9M48_031110 [Paspalum notatum var. saurae]|uniref:Uncharacterized protein n=1 Tax=Paspalum notatum var. saurae TaxID=547442 RepID=A0AAQ3U6R4_PASNO
MYSASQVERATIFCFCDCQLMGHVSRKNTMPEVLVLPSKSSPMSLSLNPIRCRSLFFFLRGFKHANFLLLRPSDEQVIHIHPTMRIPSLERRKQKDNFARDRTLVLRQLQCASEHECCAGQQEILERECLPRAETAIHAIVTNVVRYDIEDEKLAPAKDGLMVHNSTSSPAKRPMGSTDCQRSRRTFRKTR